MPAGADEAESRAELQQSATQLRETARRLRELSEQLDRLSAERAGLHAQYATLMERVWRAVRAADVAGVAVAEMVRLTGLPRHWLYRRVNSRVPPRVVGRIVDIGDLAEPPTAV